MTDEVKVPTTWSPMRMLDLCYRASDATRELIAEQERLKNPDADKKLAKLVELHATLAKFTNEVQHVWDEYVELLDKLSEARPLLEPLSVEWVVRDVLDQHEYVIRTWDREE